MLFSGPMVCAMHAMRLTKVHGLLAAAAAALRSSTQHRAAMQQHRLLYSPRGAPLARP